jgi:hypothetical protein
LSWRHADTCGTEFALHLERFVASRLPLDLHRDGHFRTAHQRLLGGVDLYSKTSRLAYGCREAINANAAPRIVRIRYTLQILLVNGYERFASIGWDCCHSN